MDPISRALIMGAAGTGGDKLYVEDVFSTWLYTGNGSTQTITNGIDLSGKGGLVWVKGRSGATGHRLTDTARGATKSLESNSTAAEVTESTGVTSFNSTGFALGADADYSTNTTTYTSWTFRKAAKFFDVVTYTGDGTTGRAISHSLGSKPGFVIIKRTDAAQDWYTVHRSQNTASPGPSGYIRLNAASAVQDASDVYIDLVNSTSTTFLIGSNAFFNTLNSQYVAYLFAHDAGGFGNSGNDNVISCGSYTGNGSTSGPTVTLGWEPQWVLIKRATGSVGDWLLSDTMRGMTTDSTYAPLLPNKPDAEAVYTDGRVRPNATGFRIGVADADMNNSGDTYIYIAIRRGPMKTPTDATKVFASVATTASSGTVRNTGIVFDMTLSKARTLSGQVYAQDRLRGFPATDTQYLIKELFTTSTGAEGSGDGYAVQHGINNYQTQYVDSNYYSGYSYILHAFRRAPGFFDVVAYTGTGVARTVEHNLGVAPELIIVKKRSAADAWVVYANNDNTDYLVLNTTAATVDDNTIWNDTSPTSSVFTVGTNDDVNGNTATFIAYLFATLSGVSKVGSYTGTGTTLNVDCGFTNGARFVLIKRTDSTGDWYVWDTARGIVSGDDPSLLLNSTAAEVTNTDYIDPLSSGFQISSTAPAAINANGGSFIFLAVA